MFRRDAKWSAATMPKATCPVCGKKFEADLLSPGFPFCSKRCKLIDLGRWLDERYSVPVEEESESEQE